MFVYGFKKTLTGSRTHLQTLGRHNFRTAIRAEFNVYRLKLTALITKHIYFFLSATTKHTETAATTKYKTKDIKNPTDGRTEMKA